jgi:hypothetical protein
MRLRCRTAGESLALASEIEGIGEVLSRCVLPTDGTEPASIAIRIDADRRPFPTDGWNVVTSSTVERDGAVVIRDVCTSGFDAEIRTRPSSVEFVFRRSQLSRNRLLNAAMRARARLLLRAALIQYPAIWLAGTRDRAPLHAAVLRAGGENLLVVGPSGVGKSTLVALEAASGGDVVSDNLCVSDGETAWGVVEPLRIAGGAGPRTSRGRREHAVPNRLPELVPDRIVLLRRSGEAAPRMRSCSPADAARALIASSYAAGELRRFWPFAATLSLATSVGNPHPPVREVAEMLAGRCPCVELTLPTGAIERLGDLLDPVVSGCV